MDSYQFKVQGTDNIYEVIISKSGNKLIVTCTCEAAKNGMFCKHRAAIFLGDSDSVVDDKKSVQLIPAFISDTSEFVMLKQINELEEFIEKQKKELAKMKKAFGHLLNRVN